VSTEAESLRWFFLSGLSDSAKIFSTEECTLRAALAFVLLTVTILFTLHVTAQTELVETGRASLPNGQEVSYRIRLLPLESFPQLPAVVASALREKHCTIPQTYEAHEPENVIHGAFEKKDGDDWAALCSVSGTTTLYVFFASQPGVPVAIRHQKDAEWLGSELAGVYGAAWGSAWGIARRPAEQLRRTAHGAALDHDGIEDAFVEKSSTVRYFQSGDWKAFSSGNQR
jgi:hypothetical protein